MYVCILKFQICMYVCMCDMLPGVEMMKALRNVTAHALERNRKSVPINAALESDLNGQDDTGDGYSTIDEEEQEEQGDEEGRMDVDARDQQVHDSSSSTSVRNNGFEEDDDDDASLFTTTSVVVRSGKGSRISPTEKRKLKKRGLRGPEIQKIAMQKARAKAEAQTAADGVVYVSSASNATGTALPSCYSEDLLHTYCTWSLIYILHTYIHTCLSKYHTYMTSTH